MSQIDRLVRCLHLTTSTNDSEALAAVRKANIILDKLGLDWGAAIVGSSGELPSHVRVTLDLTQLNDPGWAGLLAVFRWLRRSPYITTEEYRRLERIEAVWAKRGNLLVDQQNFLATLLLRSKRIDLIRELRQ